LNLNASIIVRAVAMNELTATNTTRIIGKEFLVGRFNGIVFAFISSLIAGQWFDNLALGGVDPAVASSIVLTTITVVVGFFSFLRLGAIFLL